MLEPSFARDQYPRRLHELEEEFASLASQIPDSPENQAISVLHGITQELWRNLRQLGTPLADRGLQLQDVAELYQHAPPMEGSAVSTPLPVGSPAPDFALPDCSGQQISLGEHRGQPVVLVFYPLDWSPGCSQQLDLYQHEWDEFQRRGAAVLAISVDSIYSHGAWAAVRGLTFPLLADFEPKGEVARRFRVYRDKDGFSDRALYVVDREGIIRYSHVSPFLHHVPDVYELFDALDQIVEQPAAA
jgi:peroxiredoxin